MIAPHVHLNGSGQERLLDLYGEAITALTIARRALVEASPNERDYYPLGDDAFRQARREHDARVAQVDGVLNELVAISNAVDERRSGVITP